MRGDNLGRRWQGWEDDVIRSFYPTEGAKGCARRLGRSAPSCAARAARIGVRSVHRYGRGHPWSKEDEEFCAQHLASMCRFTRRSPIAVCNHMIYLTQKARCRRAVRD